MACGLSIVRSNSIIKKMKTLKTMIAIAAITFSFTFAQAQTAPAQTAPASTSKTTTTKASTTTTPKKTTTKKSTTKKSTSTKMAPKAKTAAKPATGTTTTPATK
jgi:hypothetical protein